MVASAEREVVVRLRAEVDKGSADQFRKFGKGAEDAEQAYTKAKEAEAKKRQKATEQEAKSQEREWERANKSMQAHDTKVFNARMKNIKEREQAEKKAAAEADRMEKQRSRDSERAAREEERNQQRIEQAARKKEKAQEAAANKLVMANIKAQKSYEKLAGSIMGAGQHLMTLSALGNSESLSKMVSQVLMIQAGFGLAKDASGIASGAAKSILAYNKQKALMAAAGSSTFMMGGPGVIAGAGALAAASVGTAGWLGYNALVAKKPSKAAEAAYGGMYGFLGNHQGFGNFMYGSGDAGMFGGVMRTARGLHNSEALGGRLEKAIRERQSAGDLKAQITTLEGSAEQQQRDRQAAYNESIYRRQAARGYVKGGQVVGNVIQGAGYVGPGTAAEQNLSTAQRLQSDNAALLARDREAAAAERSRDKGPHETGQELDAKQQKADALHMASLAKEIQMRNQIKTAQQEVNQDRVNQHKQKMAELEEEAQKQRSIAQASKDQYRSARQKFGSMDVLEQQKVLEAKRMLDAGKDITREQEESLLGLGDKATVEKVHARQEKRADQAGFGGATGGGLFGDAYKSEWDAANKAAREASIRVKDERKVIVKLEADNDKLIESIESQVKELLDEQNEKQEQMIKDKFEELSRTARERQENKDKQ